MIELFKKHKDRLLYRVTNRDGGVSKAPYESLNLALHVGDDVKNVLKNREIVSQNLRFTLSNLIYMEQIHSSNVVKIDNPSLNKIKNCDALITDIRNIPLMVMVADCVPLLFYDPKNEAIGVAHAGRNGTFLEISKKTALKMKKEYGTKLNELLAFIGPSIGRCCYEVGKDLADICIRSFDKRYVEVREQNYYIDLKQLNYDQLLEVGLQKQNIEISSVCTSCDRDYFSYRREGVTGRFAGFMMIK